MISTTSTQQRRWLRFQELIIDKIMDSDVFERFEKTRGGLLIPMLLFLVGAVATVFAIETVHGIATEQLESSEPTGPIEEDAGSVDVDGVPNTDSPRGDVASDTVVPERGQPNL